MFAMPPPKKSGLIGDETRTLEELELLRDEHHLTIAVCGHKGSGKSTIIGRLLWELGQIDKGDMDVLRQESASLGMPKSAFAFALDKGSERETGSSLLCKSKEIYTNRWHYTIIDVPGKMSRIKNMIAGASQADVALLLVPSDGYFRPSLEKGNTKSDRLEGQTRQHARILKDLGIKQLIVGVTRIDCAPFSYQEDRFDAVKRETLSMLSDLGWANVDSIPVIPLSGFSGDNIVEPSDETPWWLGVSTAAVSLGSRVMTLLDALDNAVHMPERDALAPLRLSVSNVLVGGRLHPVMTGHVDQGTLKVGDEIRIVPAHRDCPGNRIGIIHSIEKHGSRVKEAKPGDVVGIAVKGMDRIHRPIVGDVVVHASDTSLAPARSFTAQVRVSDTLPGKIKRGFHPQICVSTARTTCRITKINWRMGSDPKLSAEGVKVANPPFLVKDDVAEIECVPLTQLRGIVCDTMGRWPLFGGGAALSRIFFFASNEVCMSGHVSGVDHAWDSDSDPFVAATQPSRRPIAGKIFEKVDTKIEDEAVPHIFGAAA